MRGVKRRERKKKEERKKERKMVLINRRILHFVLDVELKTKIK